VIEVKIYREQKQSSKKTEFGRPARVPGALCYEIIVRGSVTGIQVGVALCLCAYWDQGSKEPELYDREILLVIMEIIQGSARSTMWADRFGGVLSWVKRRRLMLRCCGCLGLIVYGILSVLEKRYWLKGF